MSGIPYPFAAFGAAGGHRPARGLVDLAVFWAAWMAFVSKLKLDEAALGLAVAGIAAFASALVRGPRVQFAPRVRQLLLIFWEPWYALVDTGRLLAALGGRLAGRRSRARLRTLSFETALADDPESAAQRALATLLLTVVPNTIVLGIDRRVVLVHELRPSRPSRLAERLGVGR